eukprot:TRINITY_DN11415_c0_g1_i3.p1 TRINITY_DN11415_c0_g1~~TRINITY_DN11415_c0_g1_i3.p1  ORF type:complete len:401 (+),score=26.22 TRINITY_DN11415_c0_g1_i3:71-1273(+)
MLQGFTEIRRGPPNLWVSRCERNFEVLILMFTGLVLFLTLLSFAKEKQGAYEAAFWLSPQAPILGMISGIVGTLGVAVIECVAQHVQGPRSQTRSFCLLLLANVLLNVYIATVLAKEVQLPGLSGLSLMTKLSVAMLGLEIRFSAAFVCCSCATYSLTLCTLAAGESRSAFILTDCFFVPAAGVLYLAYTSSLTDVFISLGDNAVLMRLAKLLCDGELCISVSCGEASIYSADSRLMGMIGPIVVGDSLATIMYSDAEFQQLTDTLDYYTGLMLLNSVFKDQQGQAVHVKLLAVELQRDSARRSVGGHLRLAGRHPATYFGIKVFLASGIPVTRPRPGRGPTAVAPRPFPVENMSSELPNVVGQLTNNNHRENFLRSLAIARESVRVLPRDSDDSRPIGG